MTTLTLDKKDLLAMRYLQSTDEHRHVLHGVHFHIARKATTLVATDGRRLGLLRIEQATALPQDEKAVTFTVDYPLLKFMPTDKVEVSYNGNGSVSFRGAKGGARLHCDIIEGNYPTWRQVIPSTPFEKAELNFDYRLLEGFAKLGKMLRPKETAGLMVKTHQSNNGAPAPFSIFVHDRRFYGLLMPMREVDPSVPVWIQKEDE